MVSNQEDTTEPPGTLPSDVEKAPTPGQTTHPEQVDVKAIRLFRHPPWKLRMTIEGDRSYTRVKIVRATPLSNPDHYICFLDGKDEVICMVKDPAELDPASRQIVQEEIEQRYLTAVVHKIYALRYEFGVTYWEVETDRGRRQFVMQNLSENAQWLGERRLLLIDVDGNRFEIPDLDNLDSNSAALIDLVL